MTLDSGPPRHLEGHDQVRDGLLPEQDHRAEHLPVGEMPRAELDQLRTT